jgi:hypothetical protein
VYVIETVMGGVDYSYIILETIVLMRYIDGKGVEYMFA